MTGQMGKFLIVAGGLLVAAGIILIILNKFTGLNEFPGTIKIETGNFSFTIPILASIILSVVITIVLNLVIRFFNR
jgi:uncharacterized membrane protein YidH (DUF202 family)